MAKRMQVTESPRAPRKSSRKAVAPQLADVTGQVADALGIAPAIESPAIIESVESVVADQAVADPIVAPAYDAGWGADRAPILVVAGDAATAIDQAIVAAMDRDAIASDAIDPAPAPMGWESVDTASDQAIESPPVMVAPDQVAPPASNESIADALRAMGLDDQRIAAMVAAQADPAPAPIAAPSAPAPRAVGIVRNTQYLTRESRDAVALAASQGQMPVPPDFSAPTHKSYRGKLAKLIAMANAGDIDGLRAFAIDPVSSSRKALDRYRNHCVTALAALAAKADPAPASDAPASDAATASAT